MSVQFNYLWKEPIRILLILFFFFIFSSKSLANDNTCEGIFTDVSASYKLCNFVEYLYKQRVINYQEPFYPDKPVSRAEFSQMIRRAFMIPINMDGNKFPDVTVDNIYFNDIQTIKNAKIVSGTSSGNFKPEQNLTRAEATKILVNSINYKFPNTISTSIKINISFKDIDRTNSLYSYILQLLNYSNLNNYSIINGFSDNTFRPSTFISRAQAAKIISNSVIPLNLQKVSCSTKYCTDIKLNGFPVFAFELENYLIDLINSSRKEFGLQPFVYNGDISQIAYSWNNTMVLNNTLSHRSDLTSILKSSNIDFKYNGENVATRTIWEVNDPQKYFEAVKIIHQTIMDQKPPKDQHRQNILSQSYPFDQMGLSIIITKDFADTNKNRIWIVENFIQTNNNNYLFNN